MTVADGAPSDIPDGEEPLARRARLLRSADQQLIAALVARRVGLGLSQADVAQRMGTALSNVARIEAGGRDLNQSTIRQYALAVDALIEHRVVADDDT